MTNWMPISLQVGNDAVIWMILGLFEGLTDCTIYYDF